jgi:Rieske Fe-S protein
MERRAFLGACAALGGTAFCTAAYADTAPRLYARVRLVDTNGAAIRAGSLMAETNYVFQYPYAATPCFLLRLTKPMRATRSLRRNDGIAYAWQGGVGPDRTLVAFSAICAHKLAYPTREVSFIRYQRFPRSAPTSSRIRRARCRSFAISVTARRPRAAT